MNDSTRELNQIQKDITSLHERSQSNKANISAHEAVCEERYSQIITAITELKDEVKSVHSKVNQVSELANQGRTSLKTLMWIGGVVTSVVALVVTIINVLPK